MKQLILDHFCRKEWAFLFFALLTIMIGFFTMPNEAGDASNPVPFSQIQIALFTGGLMLLSDLQQGIARALASLPLSPAQIGRAWWLATVAIPAIAIAALLFSGAGISCLFFPEAAFPARALAMASLLTLLWLGSVFVVILKMRSGLHGSWWQRVGGWSGPLILCGSLGFIHGLWRSPMTIPITCAIGGPVTAAGWIFAGRLVSGCAGVRFSKPQSKNPRGRHRASDGYGGIPRLVTSTFFPSFLMGLAGLTVLPVMEALAGSTISWRHAGESIARLGSLIPLWLVIFFQLRPVPSGLRFFRTLPISATKLTALMIAIIILPLIAVGATMAGVEGLISGPAAVITFSRNFTFTLIFAPICVFFVMWKGVGKEANTLLIFTMVCSQNAPDWIASFFPDEEIPFLLTGAVLAISLTLGFLFTRRSIMQSSLTYRVQATPSGSAMWGMRG